MKKGKLKNKCLHTTSGLAAGGVWLVPESPARPPSRQVKDGVIDVCIDNRRCIVNRLSEKKGGYLWFFARNGLVKFSNIKLFPLN